jgi:hypothetical protein
VVVFSAAMAEEGVVGGVSNSPPPLPYTMNCAGGLGVSTPSSWEAIWMQAAPGVGRVPLQFTCPTPHTGVIVREGAGGGREEVGVSVVPPQHVTLVVSPVLGGKGKAMNRAPPRAGQLTLTVVSLVTGERGEVGKRGTRTPNTPTMSPAEGEGVAHRPGTFKQERGGGVMVGVMVGVGELVGVGEAVPQSTARVTLVENPVPGGQGKGLVVLAGQ